MLTLTLALVIAVADRPFSEERLLLDRRLETLRRILPDGPHPTSDAALVKDLAQQAKLQSVEALARPPLENSNRGDVPVDVSAVGRFAEVERFFRQVSLSPRLIDVESLTLTATPEDTVRMAALVHLPYRPPKTPLPPPPDGIRSRLGGVARPLVDAFVRDQALAVAKSDVIASTRRARRNPRLFLAELASITRDRPVNISHAAMGEEFLVRGLTLGQGPARDLEARFERGFFRVSEFLLRRQGACILFEVRGRSPIVGPDAEVPLPTDDPFVQDDVPCRQDRDQGRGPSIKAPGKGIGHGPLTLRLRDIDLADVFQVLNRMTGQGFLVDGDVVGRANLELSGLTLDEALAALQKSGGIKVSTPGPVRRISLGRSGPHVTAVPPDAQTAASFSLKRSDVRDVLAVLPELDPSLAALGPPGPLGKLSLWVKDVPVEALRAAVLDAAGLNERLEEGRRLLERVPPTGDNLWPVAGEAPDRRLMIRPQDLTVLELELTGVATAGDGWVAFTYTPNGSLHAYRPGDRLADGALRSVESTDILIDTDEGPLRILLPPLSK